MNFNQARQFIYQNARPLDLARWKYLFEDGQQESVLEALSFYQNSDGGFGHGLEPDCLNPYSSPIQTYIATEIIKEVHLEDPQHPIIQGILKYLSSKEYFNGHTWLNSIPSNNEFPHAPWWTFDASQELTYNPTACLIGFILKYAQKNSSLYQTAISLLKEAYTYFKTNFPMDSMHTIACFVELYDYLIEINLDYVIDIKEFQQLLHQQIKYILTYDTSLWNKEYVCKPSLFIHSKESSFYIENKEICNFECEFISNTQENDGTWTITWTWEQYLEQWSISQNWWKSDMIIKNLKYYLNMKEENGGSVE